MRTQTKEVTDYFLPKPFEINEMQNLIFRAFESKPEIICPAA
jgi:hypothetical protein